MKSEHNKYRVGILGATGAVGQRFACLLSQHPWFRICSLMASEKSTGKRYAEACQWFLHQEMPLELRSMIVEPCRPDQPLDLVFSGLDASVAELIEQAFAHEGIAVVSNTRNHRMTPDVPLVIPEINPDHLSLINFQKARFNKNGFIVTKPNCSTIVMCIALAPLHRLFKVKRVFASTLQALSGAGYPGISALDMLDNVVPYISGEEEKMQTEPLKIFGELAHSSISLSNMIVSARCHRVHVSDGHMVTLSVEFDKRPDLASVIDAWKSYESPIASLILPSKPEELIHISEHLWGPQPLKDRDRGAGMTITVGRLSPCPLLHYKFTAVGHNTIRGASGGSVLLAELLVEKGFISKNSF